MSRRQYKPPEFGSSLSENDYSVLSLSESLVSVSQSEMNETKKRKSRKNDIRMSALDKELESILSSAETSHSKSRSKKTKKSKSRKSKDDKSKNSKNSKAEKNPEKERKLKKEKKIEKIPLTKTLPERYFAEGEAESCDRSSETSTSMTTITTSRIMSRAQENFVKEKEREKNERRKSKGKPPKLKPGHTPHTSSEIALATQGMKLVRRAEFPKLSTGDFIKHVTRKGTISMGEYIWNRGETAERGPFWTVADSPSVGTLGVRKYRIYWDGTGDVYFGKKYTDQEFARKLKEQNEMLTDMAAFLYNEFGNSFFEFLEKKKKERSILIS